MSAITEDFTRADSGTQIGHLLTWTQVSGVWGTFSNTAYKASTDGSYHAARAESALASNDQYAQVVVANNADALGAGPCVRFDASAQTYYTFVSFSGTGYLIKVVAGTGTAIGSAAHTYANGQTWRVEAEGTTIRGIVNGVTVVTVTDSSIAAGLYTGLNSYGTTATFDDFAAGDIGGGGGGVVIPVVVHHRRQQGIS